MSIEAIGGATQAVPAAAQAAQVARTGPDNIQPQATQQIKTRQETAAPREEVAADQVSVQLTLPRQTVETIEKISNISDFLNNTAKGLRQTDKQLQQSSTLLDNLGKIIKNFPPFPPDSAERRDILMSYQSIRQEINKMTIPPPPAPIYENVQMFWKDLFPNGRTNGIDTPDLKLNATDIQIEQAEEQLTYTSAAVKRLREALGSSL